MIDGLLAAMDPGQNLNPGKIGRASCRERV